MRSVLTIYAVSLIVAMLAVSGLSLSRLAMASSGSTSHKPGVFTASGVVTRFAWHAMQSSFRYGWQQEQADFEQALMQRGTWSQRWTRSRMSGKVMVAAAWIKRRNPSVSIVGARKMAQNVLEIAGTYRVDPRLVMGLIAAESEFDPRAVSPVGAHTRPPKASVKASP